MYVCVVQMVCTCVCGAGGVCVTGGVYVCGTGGVCVVQVVANYYGNRKRYEPVAGRSIHWAGDKAGPPPDEPQCGFDGSKCPPDGQ